MYISDTNIKVISKASKEFEYFLNFSALRFSGKYDDKYYTIGN